MTPTRCCACWSWSGPRSFMGSYGATACSCSARPFLSSPSCSRLAYVHFYAPKRMNSPGPLPPYPDPLLRDELELIVGELHHQLKPKPSPAPRWLSIPERGLYTGICVVGAIGSGKTKAVILPAMRQLFAYRADDPSAGLSGVVLEVKGDLCRQVQRILEDCGRGQDYVDVSLDWRHSLQPAQQRCSIAYAQAFNIASVIVAIWGKGKEPFWQQSYTDLVRYVIMLHRVRDGYVTMLDIFRTVISSGTLERMLIEDGTSLHVSFLCRSWKDGVSEVRIHARAVRLRMERKAGPVHCSLDRGTGNGSGSTDRHHRILI